MLRSAVRLGGSKKTEIKLEGPGVHSRADTGVVLIDGEGSFAGYLCFLFEG